MSIRLWPLLLLLSAMVLAQTKDHSARNSGASVDSANKLIAVNVTGTAYKPADVIAAAGLRIGDDVTEETFKAATAKLGGSGLFTDITYTYSYSAEGTKLDLQLADSTELVPVRFENFVWFSDPELIDKIHSQVGVFDGKVPVAGSLVDELASVLSGLVTSHGPKLHATYVRASTAPESPIDSIVFSVGGAAIRIRRVTFPGASPAFAEGLAAVGKKMEGGEYLRSRLSYFTDMDARSVYLKRGYLKATFGQSEPSVVSEEPDAIMVDVKLPVAEGLQYKFSGVEWAGNGSLKDQEVRSLIHLLKNRPADAIELQEDLGGVRKVYASHGYLKAQISPEPEFNDADGTVAYKLVVRQGDLYRLGEVDLDGLDEKSQARIRDDWHLREGEPYDQNYPEQFLRESAPDLPQGIHWKVTPHESINEDDKTVDVTITYVPDG